MFRQRGPRGSLQGWMWGLGGEEPRGPPGLAQAQEMAFSCPQGRLRSSQLVGGVQGWV